jgi:hypothetical protein
MEDGITTRYSTVNIPALAPAANAALTVLPATESKSGARQACLELDLAIDGGGAATVLAVSWADAVGGTIAKEVARACVSATELGRLRITQSFADSVGDNLLQITNSGLNGCAIYGHVSWRYVT